MLRMLLRILYYLVFGWLIYYVYKSFTKGRSSSVEKNPFSKNNSVVQGGEFIKDPHCHVYFPKAKAIILNHKGEIYFFCSEDCKKKFIAALQN